MKLRLVEATLPTQQDFQNKDNWTKVSQGQYDDVLKSATYDEDREKALQHYIMTKLPNLSYLMDDKNARDLLFMWYKAFNSVDPKINPFFEFLQYLNNNALKPSYQTLAIINNKYTNNLLTDKDFKNDTMASIFKDIGFFNARPEAQDYYIDIWAYFSDKRKQQEIIDTIKGTKWQNGMRFKGDGVNHQFISTPTPNKDPKLPKDNLDYRPLELLMLFYDGVEGTLKNSNLRTPEQVQANTKELSQVMKESRRLQNQGQTTNDNKQSDKTKNEIENWFRNLHLTNDQVSQIKAYLNSRTDIR